MPYSGDPSTSALDEVRFWLQDTSSSPLFADNEIRYVISKYSSYSEDARLIAAAIAVPLASRYAGKTSISVDGVSYSGGDLMSKFQKLAAALRAEYARATSSGGLPIAGGVGYCGPQPVFRLGQFDYPGTTPFSGDELNDDPANYQTGN